MDNSNCFDHGQLCHFKTIREGWSKINNGRIISLQCHELAGTADDGTCSRAVGGSRNSKRSVSGEYVLETIMSLLLMQVLREFWY